MNSKRLFFFFHERLLNFIRSIVNIIHNFNSNLSVSLKKLIYLGTKNQCRRYMLVKLVFELVLKKT